MSRSSSGSLSRSFASRSEGRRRRVPRGSSGSTSRSFARGAAIVCASLAFPALAGCAGAGAGAAPSKRAAASSQHGLIGAPAPELTAEAVTGEGPSTLQDARGKVVVVDFWATYCLPCRKSFPRYQALLDRLGGNVAVIGVSLDDPEDVTGEQIEAFAKETGVRFKILWDKDGRVARQYRPPSMPTAFVVDQEGIVRHVHTGYESGAEETLAGEIEALLAR